VGVDSGYIEDNVSRNLKTKQECSSQQHLDNWFPNSSTLRSATSSQGIRGLISVMANLKFIDFLIKGLFC